MEATLTALVERLGINTAVDLINNDITDANGNSQLTSFQKDLYYDQMFLEKLAIGQDNYVYLQLAKTYNIPKGHGKWTIRRNFGLTEHTTPLLEGIPPRSDKMKKERIEGTYYQYGRYMEFSDRVEWKLLDPVIMEYTSEYGDVAVRTLHRLARKELLNSTFKVYANDRSGIGTLEVGDVAGLADYRLAALKMSRLAVKPLDGAFKVITSEEHYWDLMKDPLILEYLGSNNGIKHYATGEIPALFNINFMKTQMDDFAYGYELGNPGEFNDGADKCRVYFLSDAGEYFYKNVPASTNRMIYIAPEYASASDMVAGKSRYNEEQPIIDEIGDSAVSGYNTDGTPSGYNTGYGASAEDKNRLSDGSWIPIRAIWTFGLGDFGAADVTKSADVATKTAWGDLYYTYDHTGGDNEKEYQVFVKLSDDSYELIAQFGTDDGVLTKALVTANSLVAVRQLPVHKSIMLGADALAKLQVADQSNVKMFVKEKGSAGVLDPINQRQSIGFKINAVGFKLIRDEACWVFHSVPTQAPATAGISLGLNGSQIMNLPR